MAFKKSNLTSNQEKPEKKKIFYHESTKGRKHEKDDILWFLVLPDYLETHATRTKPTNLL